MDTKFSEFQTWVKGLLHDSHLKDLRITFIKSDGTQRAIRCTLVESLIPKDKKPKAPGSSSTDVQRVFDLDKGEWRSFKWASVKQVETNGDVYVFQW